MEKLQSVRYRKSSDVRFGSKANIGYSITSSALTSSAAPICARCSASSSKSFNLLPQLIDGGAQSVWWPVRCAAARSRSAGPHFLFPVGWWGSAASKASAQPTHMAVAVSASPRSEFTIRGMGVVGRWALSLRLGSASPLSRRSICRGAARLNTGADNRSELRPNSSLFRRAGASPVRRLAFASVAAVGRGWKPR